MLPEHLYLRPYALFTGQQRTDKGLHAVSIELKSVDLKAGTLDGSFEITKLNEKIPRMCTYFEGEIIGENFDFFTNHKEWGATRESDLQHWRRFPHWSPRKPEPGANYIYMRWKEQFLLVPHAENIEGASFSGFYYTCLDQLSGSITGFYYQQGQPAHERYQSINLAYEWSKSIPLSVAR